MKGLLPLSLSSSVSLSDSLETACVPSSLVCVNLTRRTLWLTKKKRYKPTSTVSLVQSPCLTLRTRRLHHSDAATYYTLLHDITGLDGNLGRDIVKEMKLIFSYWSAVIVIKIKKEDWVKSVWELNCRTNTACVQCQKEVCVGGGGSGGNDKHFSFKVKNFFTLYLEVKVQQWHHCVNNI